MSPGAPGRDREALLFRRAERSPGARRRPRASRAQSSVLDADGSLLMASGRPSAFRAVAFGGRRGDRRRFARRGVLPAAGTWRFRARSRSCRPRACVSRRATSRSSPRSRRSRFPSSASTATTSGFASRSLRLLLPALFVELPVARRDLLSGAAVFVSRGRCSSSTSLLNGVLLGFWRTALDRLFPQPKRRAMIVGSGPAATLVADTIRRHSWTGVELVGVAGRRRRGRRPRTAGARAVGEPRRDRADGANRRGDPDARERLPGATAFPRGSPRASPPTCSSGRLLSRP